MEKRVTLIDTFLGNYRLMHNYDMLWYRKNFGGLDPKQGQGRILFALQRAKSIPQKDLGLQLDIRPQSLGELLHKLEANGYIVRKRSTTDKRALIVELTEKGENFQLNRPDYSELFRDMSAKERTELKKSLKKISERLAGLIELENEEEFY